MERVQRRAVVDQPQVRRASAAGSGCAACGRRWSPARRARRRRPRARRRAARVGVVGQRAGQEVDAEVDARRWRAISSWISGSGSAAPSAGSSSISTSSGTGRPSAAGQLARHDLRRERLRPLARAAELEHVEAVVVGLDDAPAASRPRAGASRSGWRSPCAARLASWLTDDAAGPLDARPTRCCERAAMGALHARARLRRPTTSCGAGRSRTSTASGASIWDRFGVGERGDTVLASREMPGAPWFPGTPLNYAEHAFRGKRRRRARDRRRRRGRASDVEWTWGELRAQTRADRGRPAGAGRRARRPRRRLHAEHPRDRRRPSWPRASLGAVWSSAARRTSARAA